MQPLITQYAKKIKKFVKFCNKMVLKRLILYERMKSLKQNIEKIYNEHAKTVRNYIFCLCNDKSLAEEVTQETFYKAMKGIKKFRGDCKIEVWLCQIAKNVLFEERKRRRKIVLVSMDSEVGDIMDTFASGVDIEEEIIEREEKAELYKQIQKLDGPTKELVVLRLTTGLTYKDIAHLLGKTEAWVRVEFYRWKEKVKGGEKYETTK